MIDYIRFRIKDKNSLEERIDELTEKGIVSTSATFYNKFGKKGYSTKKAKIANMEVIITNDFAYIEGSVHKFHNYLRGRRNHNSDDFTSEDCLSTIKWICEFFRIDPKNTVVTNLEYGFNLDMNYSASKVIKENITLWNFDTHNKRQKYTSNGVTKEFGLKEYRMKIYAKGEESKIMTTNLIRVELKITAKRILSRLKIFSISDINYNSFKALFKEFLKQFDRLLIIDSINPPEGIEMHDAIFFIEYTKFDRWNLNKKVKSNYERMKDKKKLMKLLEKTNYNKIQKHIRALIIQKHKSLTTPESKPFTLLTI
jgi:hypothetical protein